HAHDGRSILPEASPEDLPRGAPGHGFQPELGVGGLLPDDRGLDRAHASALPPPTRTRALGGRWGPLKPLVGTLASLSWTRIAAGAVFGSLLPNGFRRVMTQGA